MFTAQEFMFVFMSRCEFDDTLMDMMAWCRFRECSFEYFTSALLKKVFQVTQTMNEVSALFAQETPTTDLKALTLYYTNVGLQMGKLYRYATDFDSTAMLF